MPVRRFKAALFLATSLCMFAQGPAYAESAADAYTAMRGLDYSRPAPPRDNMAEDTEFSFGGPRQDALPQVPADDLKPRVYARVASPGSVRTTQAATTAPAVTDDAPSRLEQAYSDRFTDHLQQFGYTLFNPESTLHDRTPRPGMPAGAVQDDFILSNADKLEVTFRGQRSSSQVYTVNAQGQLLVDDLQPINAAGRTIGQVRKALEAEVATMPNEQVFVTLDTVRQIDVLVVGHVRKPGRQTLTVFDTVLDALEDAGGIDKTGSLRQIKLVRDGRSTVIDLYGLLVYGSTNMDMSLRDGDRLIVPPVGATVAVGGGVKRPGIYELPYGARGLNDTGAPKDRLSLDEMLDLAGGLLTPGQIRYMRLSLTSDGQETVRETRDGTRPQFGDGDILSVAPAIEQRTGTVELAGDARKPGIHALDKAHTLAQLLGSERAFGPDIYPLIGLIERQDRQQMTGKWIAFPPLQVIKGKFDRTLQDGDIVHLFSRGQIMALQNDDPDHAPKPLAEGDAEDPVQNPAMPDQSDNGPLTDPVMISHLQERSVFVRGAVRQPGPWPVADGTTLDSVIAAAGGMTLDASAQNVEVTSISLNEGAQKAGGPQRRQQLDLSKIEPSSVTIAPGDSVRVNQKFNTLQENSVLIAGQVMHPGRYDLLPGDHLSDLLKRAGGVTKEAYPQGTIFSRMSERKAEEQRFRAEARNLEVGLAASLNQKADKPPNADQIGAVEQLIGQLKDAEGVGRITVESDPDALESDPAVDILLEGGDRVYVPQRPLTVRVAGEILSPSNLQFRKDKDPRDYIMEAGGFTFNADKDRAFVLYPDGSAQPLQVSAWNHNATFIPPGSTIIVPRDPKPFDFIETARDITQILSNLAVTGIFVNDIHKN